MLAFDVQGAFDNINHSHLLNKMHDMGINPQLTLWTQSFLANRSATLVFDNQHDVQRLVNTSTPQGSPVSPILFTLATASLFKSRHSSFNKTRCISFIDDGLMYVSSPSILNNIVILEREFADVIRDTCSDGVNLDPGKCKLLHAPKGCLAAETAHNTLLKFTMSGTQHTVHPQAGPVRWLSFHFTIGAGLPQSAMPQARILAQKG